MQLNFFAIVQLKSDVSENGISSNACKPRAVLVNKLNFLLSNNFRMLIYTCAAVGLPRPGN